MENNSTRTGKTHWVRIREQELAQCALLLRKMRGSRVYLREEFKVLGF